MDPSNYANRHEQLGVGDNTPTSSQSPRESRDLGNDTLDAHPSPQKAVEGRDNVYNPGKPAPTTIKHTGNDAKWDTVAGTEIGDPNGRIPTAQETHDQLAAARSAELAVDDSKAVPGPPRSGYGDDPQHRPANIETATMRQATKRLLEPCILSLTRGVRRPLFRRPSTRKREPGTELHRGLGQKVTGLFAWAHGAGELICGKTNADIAKLSGEKLVQQYEEETARRGQREMINHHFQAGITSALAVAFE
ncbi:hypothetical protein VP1G_10098 [Cytospora mali]|uniref:Uncharacterized protein n=1 Tax=Cytospora mali TaxID=578113 RepID=A0A194VGH7_CYTMA|nr:hypothetical protein VP1G_10098 [Valsa mali var. pyri (nom. inval.)]